MKTINSFIQTTVKPLFPDSVKHPIAVLFVLLFVCIFGSSCSSDDDLLPQPQEESKAFTVDTLLAMQQVSKAQVYGPLMWHLADSIAKLHGGKVCPINYKTLESTLRKCWTDSCQATSLKDLARCTIACPYDSICSMITDLITTAKSKKMFKRYKHQEVADIAYWGDIVNIDHQELVSEIQVKSFYMAYACYTGDLSALIGDSLITVIRQQTGREPSMSHHYYEIIRDITGKYTEEEKSQAVQDAYNYVHSFWQKYTLGTVFYKE